MNSKDKGNIGEAAILAEFTKYGIQVSLPFGDNARYDMIADIKGQLKKIQIKYCSGIRNNAFVVYCASSTNHTTNKHRTTYENDVDFICAYLAPINRCVIIPIEVIGSQGAFNLRLTPAKNNQSTVHFVDDYTFEKYFK